MDAEVAHQRREVDARRVEPRVLEAPAVRERIDDGLGEDERAAREVQRRLRALDDVAPDRQLADEIVGEHVLVEPHVVGLERPAEVRQDRVVGVAHVGVDADPAVGVGEGDEARRRGRSARGRGCARRRTARPPGDPGERDVEVPERELDPALVVDGQVARRRGVRGRVEVGRADCLESASRGRRPARSAPAPRPDRGRRRRWRSSRRARARGRSTLARPRRSVVSNDEPSGRVVVGRHVEVDRLGRRGGRRRA